MIGNTNGTALDYRANRKLTIATVVFVILLIVGIVGLADDNPAVLVAIVRRFLSMGID